jgi:hypothetical protein
MIRQTRDRGDKVNHATVTFFRSAPGQLWVRLDGFAQK